MLAPAFLFVSPAYFLRTSFTILTSLRGTSYTGFHLGFFVWEICAFLSIIHQCTVKPLSKLYLGGRGTIEYKQASVTIELLLLLWAHVMRF